jgi:hypothetical protein
MGYPQTTSTQQARSILAAWRRRDQSGLVAELRRTQLKCTGAAGLTAEEQERLELLDGIAAQMRQDLHLPGPPSERAETCLHLLEHLAAGDQTLLIRSGKLSFFPYSRSARQTSACR